MRIIREWVHRLAGLLRRGRPDRELQEELELHLALAAEDAARRGRTGEHTVRDVRLRAGGVAQAMEALRDQRGVPALSGTGQDIRMAIRSLRATPLVTAVAIASLALAIGANTAIFSIANSLLLRALPVSEPARLVHITDSVRQQTGETRIRAWSNPFWEQIYQQPDLFEAATAWSFVRFNLARGGEAQFVEGMWAAGGYFDTLGVEAILGRTFSPRDDQRGGGPDGPVAVISYGYWQRHFGGAADAIGRSLNLNGVPFTVIGVTAPEFFGTEVGRTFDMIVPLRTEALIRGNDSVLESSASNFLSVLARLKTGQSSAAAALGLRGQQPQIRAATLGPWDKAQIDRYLVSPFTVVPASTGYSNLRSAFQRPLAVIAAVVGLVLLIGCVNVANLLLARALGRRHELSVQVALGAARWRVVRQLFAESVVLSVAGAALGVVVAAAGSRFLVRQLSTPANVVFLDVSIDGRVLAFTVAVSALTALLFGTVPAFRAARAQPIDALKDKGRMATGHGRGGVMGWLVAMQVALSVVLLVGAGLFIRSFVSLAGRDFGFQPEQVLVVTIDPLQANVDPGQRVAIYERAHEAVLRLPGVAAAAISHVTPVGGGGFTPAVEISTPAGRTRVEADGEVFGNRISPGWFDTYGTRVLAGRDFDSADRKGTSRVAVVNESFARRFLAGAAIGRTLTVYPDTPRAMQMQIVGVVADAIYSSPREPAPATWYMPIAQFDMPGFAIGQVKLSVRATSGSPALLTQSVATAISAVNPQLALTFRALADQISGSLRLERLLAQLAGFFGALALLLAGLGLYGVTAYAISRRRTEIGIRLALGAAPSGVVALVLGRVLILVTAGVVIGGILSLWAAGLVGGLIHGLPPRDPATLGAAASILLALGLLAAWLPARRAARVDPAAVLREG
jgi:predicted permease